MNVYYDAFLSRYVTEEIENRALDDIDAIGTFPEEWRQKLAVPRSYVLICQEKQASADDLFADKLKIYSKEFDKLLIYANQAAAAASGEENLPIFTIPVERA